MNNLSRLLKESWTLVEEHQDKVAGYFYARMFLSQPAAAGPVPGADGRAALPPARRDRHGRADGRRPGDASTSTCASLGRDHRKFHVRPGALRRRGRRADRGAADVRRRAVERRVRPGVARRVRGDRREDARRRRRPTTNPPYWHAEVLTHERRGRGHRRLHLPADAAAGVPGRASTSASSAAVPAAAVAHLLGRRTRPREDNTLEFHVRAVGAGWVSSALVRRLQGRRHAPAGRADGLDDPGPPLHPGHRLRRRRHRAGPDQGAGRGADPLQPDPLGARLLRRAGPRGPVRPGRAEPAGRPLPVAVGGAARAATTRRSPASRATSPTWWPATARGTSTTSSSPAPAPMVRATLRTLAEMQVPSIRIKYDTFTEIPQ